MVETCCVRGIAKLAKRVRGSGRVAAGTGYEDEMERRGTDGMGIAEFAPQLAADFSAEGWTTGK